MILSTLQSPVYRDWTDKVDMYLSRYKVSICNHQAIYHCIVHYTLHTTHITIIMIISCSLLMLKVKGKVSAKFEAFLFLFHMMVLITPLGNIKLLEKCISYSGETINIGEIILPYLYLIVKKHKIVGIFYQI